MKKNYIAPAVCIVEMADEASIICASLPVSNDGKKNDIVFQSINRPGVWDSSNWAEVSEQNNSEDK